MHERLQQAKAKTGVVPSRKSVVKSPRTVKDIDKHRRTNKNIKPDVVAASLELKDAMGARVDAPAMAGADQGGSGRGGQVELAGEQLMPRTETTSMADNLMGAQEEPHQGQ
ncbi:unnamed protein product [Urochloa humidicola]